MIGKEMYKIFVAATDNIENLMKIVVTHDINAHKADLT